MKHVRTALLVLIIFSAVVWVWAMGANGPIVR